MAHIKLETSLVMLFLLTYFQHIKIVCILFNTEVVNVLFKEAYDNTFTKIIFIIIYRGLLLQLLYQVN